MQNNQKIPEGWSVKKLREVGTFTSGIAFPEKEQGGSDGVPFFKVSDMNLPENNYFMKGANNYVTIKQIEALKYKPVQCTAIIFAKVGAAIFLERKRLAKNFLMDNNMMAFIPHDNPQYFKILFDTIHLSKYAQVGALPSYNSSDLRTIKVLLPPLAEQEKIAGILGTWDEAIEKLSSLIEQKKNLKKGLMQRLLTGKTRLKGFTQPWKEVKLGDMCKMFSGGTPLVSEEKYYKNGNIPFIRSGEISSFKTELFITEKALENSSAKMIEKGDLLYALYGATSGEIAISKINGAINQAILCIRSTKIEISYLYYVLLNSKSIILSKYLQGGQGNLSADIVKKLSIKMPSDTNEQQAIADVLSTADEEINLLNKKLEVLKEQKKGLMQQLLTGKTRVKVN